MVFALSSMSITNMSNYKPPKTHDTVPISSVFEISHHVSETRDPRAHGKHSSLVSPPVIHAHMASAVIDSHLSPPPPATTNYPAYSPSRNLLLSPASMVLDVTPDDSVSSFSPPLFVSEEPSSPCQRARELRNDIHACLDRVAESQQHALYQTQSQVYGGGFSLQFVGCGYNDMYRRNCPDYLKQRRLEQKQYMEARGSYQRECEIQAVSEKHSISSTIKHRTDHTPMVAAHSEPSNVVSRFSGHGGILGGRIKKFSERQSLTSGANVKSAARSLHSTASSSTGVSITAASAAYAVAIAASAEPVSLAEPVVPASPRSRRAITSGATRGVAGSGVFTLEGFGRESGRRGAIASREDKNFEHLTDICPPVSTLNQPNSGTLKTDWKGNPINLDNDPYIHLLHPQEIILASTLRLDCATYLTSKRRLFLSRLDCLERGKIFRKTDAQTACHIDVNKASRLYTAYEGVGWLAESWVEQHRGRVDLSPVQKST